ncbi:hypothetical protein ACTXT7_016089, partial [Hymenolepis weldensis]
MSRRNLIYRIAFLRCKSAATNAFVNKIGDHGYGALQLSGIAKYIAHIFLIQANL